MNEADRFAPPENGLPIVENICDNGHTFAGGMAFTLPLVFHEDVELTVRCPKCHARRYVASGIYEPDRSGIYRRVGPPPVINDARRDG